MAGPPEHFVVFGRKIPRTPLTWLKISDSMTLLRMQKRTIRPGRPAGVTTYESAPALAFGQAVRAARLAQGIAQDEFAGLAGIARSHMGKIKRGEHMPTLALILKISLALKISSAELMKATERNLYLQGDA